MVVHHISGDGFSMGPLTRDVMVAYEARSRGEVPGWAPLAVQYADYALWQREVLGSEDDAASLISRQVEFWSRALAGLPDQLDLPADRPRPVVASNRGADYSFVVGADVHAGLSDVARESNSSLFMVVHAALAVLLARLSGTSDIAIGTPVAGRGEQVLDDVIGMFVNTLVLRTEVEGAARFVDLLAGVREADLQAFGHADVPFERLVEVLNPERSQARNPLFQVMLVFQNMEQSVLELGDLTVAGVDAGSVSAKFDLQLTVVESFDDAGAAAGMAVSLTYATDLFDESTVASFAERFGRILTAAAADSAVRVGDVELLDSVERSLVLDGWNDQVRVKPEVDTTLVSMFDAQVLARGMSTAVVFEDRRVSYVDLDAAANRLARKLIESGVGPESLVAVLLPRSVDLVVSLLAVLKAGGAYLPIDPSYPAERIAFTLDAARPVCVLGGAELDLDIPVFDVASMDVSKYDGSSITDHDRVAPLRDSNSAYVIYTSGSTGRPKGVAVSHRNVVELFANSQSRFEFDDSDVWTLFHSYAFDFSVWELWGALSFGGTVVVVDFLTSRSPEQFRELVARERVTVLNQTPSAFYQFAEADRVAGQAATPLSLRYVIFGGEALDFAQLERWFERHNDRSPRLVNMYGITETTVHVSFLEVDAVWAREATASVIGRGLGGLSVFVLDDRLRPAPVGVRGEMYIAGEQLSRGYVGQPGLTAGRFVANPFAHTSSGAVMYRTGDVGRWSVDGQLEYAGRSDFQVQLRGFRIELGEIEAALLRVEGVARAVVLVRSDAALGDRLVGYVVPESGVDLVVADVLSSVAQFLTGYMVPDSVMVLEELPLTVNGKLDRKLLPEPVFEKAVFRAPVTAVEEIVASVFAEALGVDRVGLDDDFFALGGNSLIATRVAARLGQALDAQVPVRVLFEASSVELLAARVESEVGSGARAALTAMVRPERIPLSLAQQRMWFLNRFEPESTAYNIPVAIRLSGSLDVAALQAAVSDVVARHEVLRTVYPEVDGVGFQEILSVDRVVLDLSPVVVSESGVVAAVSEFLSAGFDVAVEVPVRARLFAVSESEFVLAMVVHHISGDGFSMGPLTRDVMVAYEARSRGEVPGWAPLAVQYADYALWQREVLGSEDDAASLISRQVEFWSRALAGLPDQLDLPADRPRPVVAVQSWCGISSCRRWVRMFMLALSGCWFSVSRIRRCSWWFMRRWRCCWLGCRVLR